MILMWLPLTSVGFGLGTILSNMWKAPSSFLPVNDWVSYFHITTTSFPVSELLGLVWFSLHHFHLFLRSLPTHKWTEIWEVKLKNNFSGDGWGRALRGLSFHYHLWMLESTWAMNGKSGVPVWLSLSNCIGYISLRLLLPFCILL